MRNPSVNTATPSRVQRRRASCRRDEDMENEDDMIEFEESFDDMRNKKGERIHGRNNQHNETYQPMTFPMHQDRTWRP